MMALMMDLMEMMAVVLELKDGRRAVDLELS